jgi:O-antigen/teichoic acid export membrane protein
LMTVLGIIAGLPCLMFPRQMLSVFRTEYAAAAAPLRILSLYPMFYGPYLAVLQYVISSRLQKTYFAMISVVGLISMLLALWLVPSFGSTGAAISVVVAISIALFLFLIVSLASVTQSLTNDRSAA